MNSEEQDDLIYEPKIYDASHGLVLAILALVGLLGGVVAGLVFTWEISPSIDKNTAPDQLRDEYKHRYIAAIANDYAYSCTLSPDGCDIVRAYNLLLQVDPLAENPFQMVADTVCEIAYSGTMRTSQDVEDILAMIALYESQGIVADCDLQPFATSPPPTPATLLPTLTPRPTDPPVATKTPTIARQPTLFPSPTPRPAQFSEGDFVVRSVQRNCDPGIDGLIEVSVRDALTNDGIPGIRVQVTWNADTGQVQQSFYTGLKPDRSDGYADFQMEPGFSYLVQLPGLSEPTQRLQADVCDEEGTLYYYQVIFESR